MKTVFSSKDGKPIIFLPSSRGYLYIAYVWIVWKSVFLFKSSSHRWAQTKGAPELLLPRVSKVKFTVNKTNKSQALLFVFSFIGNSTLRSLTLRERLRVTESWTHIESRQFIGWWRDAVSDAMTSSGHTGEHAIHSSDFSAFTKRSHCPSLLRFLTHLLPLWLSVCTSATASVELCSPRGEVPWSFGTVYRRARVSSLAKTHTVSVFCAWVFRMHVRRFMGPLIAKFATISVS